MAGQVIVVGECTSWANTEESIKAFSALIISLAKNEADRRKEERMINEKGDSNRSNGRNGFGLHARALSAGSSETTQLNA